MSAETVKALTVEGLTYYYRLLRQPDPQTEPILVLGGALQDKHGWTHLDEPVGPLASLLTLDLPGAGQADPLRHDQGMGTMCRAVERVLDDLGFGRVNLFGYSFGARIAFSFAQRHPDRISRLLLGGVPAYITEQQIAQWQDAARYMARGAPDEFIRRALRLWLCQDESRTVRHRKLAHRYVKRLVTHAISANPRNFTHLHRSASEDVDARGGLQGVPTLVFCGEHDTVSAPHSQAAFARTISGGRFLTIPESDHWVCFERPQEVTELIAAFFTDQSLCAAEWMAESEYCLEGIRA
ncbi:alpha/beta fold hydrolase [Streptomyces sp. NPDC057555]|uniref:alpha/beta fold hydrolase n=1 Tax=Streptomyces sp. NPDC057555 TaxID=3346166 RepID=UPI00368D347E